MSAQGAHVVTQMFEAELCRYTGATYAIAVDSATSALELCLMAENVKGTTIEIPNHTYPSVPCAIILAGAKVRWRLVKDNTITGAYRLGATRIWDSALRFTCDMYLPGSLMCISFTGAYKALKLGKGGAILCDRVEDYEWFKRARNSGRGECSYHVDDFRMLGRNVYMMPMVAAQGLLLMNQFYTLEGEKIPMPDKTIPYPDLSKFPIYTQ